MNFHTVQHNRAIYLQPVLPGSKAHPTAKSVRVANRKYKTDYNTGTCYYLKSEPECAGLYIKKYSKLFGYSKGGDEIVTWIEW